MIKDIKTLESSIASCTKAMDEKFSGASISQIPLG